MHATVDDREDIQFIIDLIYERSRIRLNEGKEQLIRARLGKRMRKHGFTSLSEYCQFLRHQTDEEEISMVVDALTTNFTSFLRERDHFDFLTQNAVPALLGKNGKTIRIWSAACSSGEEPFSIAFCLEEAYPFSAGWDWKVMATDISTKVLDKARAGIYRDDQVEGLPREWLRKYFQRGEGASEGYYRIKNYLSERVAFHQLNLLGAYSFREPFQVIFCRNVMIYFDRPTQEQLVKRLSQFLAPQGYLLVGHSESLIGLSVPLRCLRPSIYQKL